MKEDGKLLLNINPGPSDDTEDLEKLTRQLHQDINELDVEKVDFIRREEVPKGAMAGDVVAWGSLLVTLATPVLPPLINGIQSWLSRHSEKRSITIEIGGDKLEVSGISSEEQKRLVDTWISRQKEKLNTND